MFNQDLKQRVKDLEEGREDRIKTTERILEVFGVSLDKEKHAYTTDELLELKGVLPKLQEQIKALMDHLKLEFKEESVIKRKWQGGFLGNNIEYIDKEIKVVPKSTKK